MAGVGAGGDVEEDDLVGALGVVAGGQLDRVAGVDQVDEVDALDHPAGVDVEAGDHPDAAHAAIASSTVKQPVVEGLAHDRPGQPRGRPPPAWPGRRGRPADPTPPEAITSTAVASSTAARPSRSGPARVPSRAISVTTTAATPQSSKRASRSNRSTPDPSVQPRTATSPAPDVDADRHLVVGGQVAHQLGFSTAAVPMHHPVDARRQQRLGRGLVAHAPAGLHLDARRRRRRRWRRSPGRFSGVPVRAASRSTTWIHAGAGGGEALGHGDGVDAVGRLLGEVALVEADRPTAAQVNRRIQIHLGVRQTATKLARMRSPAAPDFSGWNWVAHRLSRWTAATTGPP